MLKALVQPDGRVAQVEPVPAGGGDPFDVAPSFSWEDAPDNVVPEYTFDMGTGLFTPPPGPPIPSTTWQGKTKAQITDQEALKFIKEQMASMGL